jgi:hypothetical protein
MTFLTTSLTKISNGESDTIDIAWNAGAKRRLVIALFGLALLLGAVIFNLADLGTTP